VNWLLHWLAVHTGTVNESGPYYGFWSGFGSDLGEVTLIGAVVAGYRHSNCHTRHCWRIARHPVEGTPYKVCRRCHPTVPTKAPTRSHILAAHHEARRLKERNGHG
jgi:hypothetical protein